MPLSIVVDGIVILIFVACILDGYRRGFVKMLLSIAAIIISAAVASALSAPVAQWASEEFVAPAISGYIESSVDGILEDNGISADALAGEDFEGMGEEITQALPEGVLSLLEEYDISVEEVFDDISSGDTVKAVSEKITENIQQAVILPVLEAAAFLLVYIICSSVLSIVVSVISSAFKLPVLKQANKALGSVLGAIKGIFVIAVICVLAVIASGFITGNELADAVSNAALTNAISKITLGILIGG